MKKFPLWAKILIPLVVLFIIAGIVGINDPVTMAKIKHDDSLAAIRKLETPPPVAVIPPKPHILTSLSQAQDRFNNYAINNGFDFRIKHVPPIKIGDSANTAGYSFSENIKCLFTINKTDGMIREFVLIASGEGTEYSGMQIMAAMMCSMAMVDPTLKPKIRGALLHSLIEGSHGEVHTESLNGIEYSFLKKENTPAMLAISKSEDSKG